MKIHTLHCGDIRIAESLTDGRTGLANAGRAALAPDSRRVSLPVSAYLIEHKKGLFLVDTGISRDISPAGSYDRKAAEQVIGLHLAALYHPYVPAGMAVHEQLEEMGIRPEDLDAVLITNFDIDHVAGLKHVLGAKRVIVPEDEAYWSVRTKYTIRQNRNLWEFDNIERVFFRGYLLGPMHKAIDVLGDGSLMMVSMPGYTDGQVGIMVFDKSGYIILASDAAYSLQSLDSMTPPGLAAERDLHLKTMRWLKHAAEDPACMGVFFNHDEQLRMALM